MFLMQLKHLASWLGSDMEFDDDDDVDDVDDEDDDTRDKVNVI